MCCLHLEGARVGLNILRCNPKIRPDLTWGLIGSACHVGQKATCGHFMAVSQPRPQSIDFPSARKTTGKVATTNPPDTKPDQKK